MEASNDVILQKVDDLIDTNEKSHLGIIKSIDALSEHVKRTNGQIVSLRIWRGFLTGGLAVITAIVIPMLIYVLKDKL